jgi:hypothetical protein
VDTRDQWDRSAFIIFASIKTLYPYVLNLKKLCGKIYFYDFKDFEMYFYAMIFFIECLFLLTKDLSNSVAFVSSIWLQISALTTLLF